jgi:hypothetical protein
LAGITRNITSAEEEAVDDSIAFVVDASIASIVEAVVLGSFRGKRI